MKLTIASALMVGLLVPALSPLIVTSAFAELLPTSAFGEISIDSAIAIACKEGRRVEFDFGGNCEDEIWLKRETPSQFVFAAHDVSGDCGIQIFVNRKSEKASSQVSCL